MTRFWIREVWRGATVRRSLAGLLGLFMLAGFAAIPAGAGAADTVMFELSITGYELSTAEDVLRVHEGDRVEIHLQSDTATIVHLHGYNIEVPVSPGVAGKMAFEANATGRFPVMLHGKHSDGGNRDGALFYLEVQPR